MDEGDLAEGIAAAGAVGDDRLHEMAGRAVQPEAFTHGSSAQRVQGLSETLMPVISPAVTHLPRPER